MKKLNSKLFLMIAFMIVSLFILTSCGKTLATPKNVMINEHGMLTWDSVEHAKGYKVLINDTEYDTTKASYDLSKLNLSVGTHAIKVKAITDEKGFLNSKYSEILEYVITETGPRKLSTPTNVRIEGDKLVWSSVAGATSYNIIIGDITKTTTTTSFSLSELGNIEGVIWLKVQAVASGYLASNPSETVKHTNQLSVSGFKAKIKQYLMTKHDYPEATAQILANEYVDGFFLEVDKYANLGNALLYEFFVMAFDFISNDDPDVISLIEALVNSEFTNTEIAQFLRGFGIMFLDNVYADGKEADYEERIEEYQNQIATFEQMINSILTEFDEIDAEIQASGYYELYNQIKDLKVVRDDLNRYIETIYYYDYLISELQYFEYYQYVFYYYDALRFENNESITELEFYNPWLVGLKEEILSLIETDRMISQYESEFYQMPLELQEKFYRYDYLLNEKTYRISWYYSEIESLHENIAWLEQRIIDKQRESAMFVEVIDYLKENEQTVLDALVVPIKFVRSGVSENLETIAELYYNPNLTPAEILEIKNAFVTTIFSSEVMPTQAEFDAFLNVFKEMGEIVIEFRAENFETFPEEYEILMISLTNGLEYLSTVYAPMINIYKEVLLSATLSDIEALMNAQNKEELMQIVAEFALRLQENSAIVDSMAIIEDAMKDLIFTKGFDVIPLIITYATEEDFDFIFALWNVLTESQDRTLRAIEELTIIPEMIALSYMFYTNGAVNITPLDMLELIDWNQFVGMTSDDIANATELAKALLRVIYFYNQELEPESFLLTEEQFDQAVDTELIGKIVAQLGDLFGQMGLTFNDLYQAGVFDQYTYENIVRVAQTLGQLYDANSEALDLLFADLETLLVDNPFVIERFGRVEKVDLDEIKDEIRELFAIAKSVGELDLTEIEEWEKEMISTFSREDFPTVLDFFRLVIANQHQVDFENIGNLVENEFYHFVSEGKGFGVESSEYTFTAEELLARLDLTIYDFETDYNGFSFIFQASDGCYFEIFVYCDVYYIYKINTDFATVLE